MTSAPMDAARPISSFPEPGTVFQTGDLKVTVLQMDGRRVEKILVERVGAEEKSAPDETEAEKQ